MGSSSTTEDFWKCQTEKSAIKTAIVVNFFVTYISIISNHFANAKKYYYIDLFSGPGKFENGKESTPLQIFDFVNKSKNKALREKMQFVFNDANSKCYQELKLNLMQHELYGKLKYRGDIFNLSANEVDIEKYLKTGDPVFSFIDPFGYKGTSAEQIWNVVKNVGSDCIFFFNANRFIMDFSKDKETDFKPLFGNYYNSLSRVMKTDKSHFDKMRDVLNLFSRNLFDMAKQSSIKFQIFILPFAFCFDDREKESHYLLFITKNYKALTEMKNVMSRFSNSISEELGFDSKKVNQLTLYNIFDNKTPVIIETLKIINRRGSLYNQQWTPLQLLEYVDKYSMYNKAKVSPFTIKEFKKSLRAIYNKGYINEPLHFRTNEVFSDSKQFTFRKEKLEISRCLVKQK